MKNISKDQIKTVILEEISEYAVENNIESLLKPTGQSRLYGPDGLDSLGLVIFIGELEDRIDDQFDIQLSLADEKAMSQSVSPFRSINALASYIEKLINTNE